MIDGALKSVYDLGLYALFRDATVEGEQPRPPLQQASKRDTPRLSRGSSNHANARPNNQAVALGLERTGRIVTEAALLFSVATGAFVTSKLVFIKELGLGAALAVLTRPRPARPVPDGTLGKWSWWAPAPLR